jgi:hypothetical protein
MYELRQVELLRFFRAETRDMAARSYDHLRTLHPGEAIDRLLAAGMPLHQIEDLLDDIEHEEAQHLQPGPGSQSLFGYLLWI